MMFDNNYQGIFVQRLTYFQNQQTRKIDTVRLNLMYEQFKRTVNFTKTLNNHPEYNEIFRNCQIFYMNPMTRVCQYLGKFPFDQEIYLELDINTQQRLHFKYKKIQNIQLTNLASRQTNAKNSHCRKAKERTIIQVQQNLQKWKNIYNKPQETGRFYTLQEAAEKIGMPKKTLDDYSKQIKLAQAMNFDFDKYKNEKMGTVRNFVRENLKTGIKKQVQNIFDYQKYLDMNNHEKMGY